MTIQKMTRRNLFYAVVAFLCILNFVLHQRGLDEPQVKPGKYMGISDEKYYVVAARSFVVNGTDTNYQHPPLGKLLVALSILLFGNNPVGWRMLPSIFGAVLILIVFLIAFQLSRDYGTAILSAILVCFDPILFLLSRLAFLDIFQAVFIASSYLFFIRFLESLELGGDFLLSSIFFGLGISVKITTFTLALVYLLLMLMKGTSLKRILFLAVIFASVVSAVYVSSYAHFFVNGTDFVQSRAPVYVDYSFMDWLNYQVRMITFHMDVRLGYNEMSLPAWAWFFTSQPWFTATARRGSVRLYLIADPYLYIPSLIDLTYILVSALRKRNVSLLSLPLMFLAQFLPWIVSPRMGYPFYLVPMLPYLLVSLSLVVRKMHVLLSLSVALISVLFFVGVEPMVSGRLLT